MKSKKLIKKFIVIIVALIIMIGEIVVDSDMVSAATDVSGKYTNGTAFGPVVGKSSESDIKSAINTRNNGVNPVKNQCAKYVSDKLAKMGCNLSTYGNGKDWYKNINTYIPKGYTVESATGRDAIKTLTNRFKNKALYNVVVSFGPQKGGNTAGHVMLIDCIKDGKVYYTESYDHNKVKAGSIHVSTIDEYIKWYLDSNYKYSSLNGAMMLLKKGTNDVTSPQISNWKITNLDSKNITIECDITDNVKVSKAQISVWKDGDASTTAKFYDYKSVSGNHYIFKWSVDDFGGYIGKFRTNIHAWDSSNNKTMHSYATDGYLLYTPTIQPTITNTKPSGVVDSVVCDTSGKIHVQGWAYDPDSKGTALDIHVYVGGPASPNVPCTVIKANLERKDVNKAFGCGDYHGFNAQINTNKLGNVPVYIYAIDTAGGDNSELGNRTVSVETEKPIGVFEKVESVSANKIHVAGWAYDPDTKDKAVTIAVYIGGQCNVAGVEKHEITANITRDDINASKNCGSKHGFDAVITTQKRGVQGVYVWAHNTDGSPSNINTFLGNTDVNIHDCNAVIDHAVAATYETTGLTEGSHCSVCGKVIVAQEIIPKIVKDSSDDMKESEDDNKFYDDKEKITYDEGIDIDKEKLIYGDEYDDIDKEKQNLINNSSTTGKEDVSPQNVENDKKSLVDSSISQKNNNKAETDSSKSLGDKTSQSNVSSDDKTNTSRNVENEEEDEDDEFVIGNASYEIIAGNRVMLTSVKDEKLQSFNVPNTVTFNLKKYSVVCVFDEAFMNCKSLKKIVIGKNIEEIGDYAFKNCSSLKNITIKTTKLTKSSFGKKAFKGINKKATFKCPKKQYKNYKKWIKKAGAPKAAKYKK